jgi:Ca-activated chloride channel family protein
MKQTSRIFAVFLVAIVPLALQTCAQAAMGKSARIRVETDLVNVPATVLDASGKPVADLPESAFQLFENGVPQKIDRFEALTNRPLELALMMDSSLSALKEMKFEREATARFIRLVVQPGDLLSVFEFSDEVVQLSPFSSDVPLLESSAERISPGGGTSLYDAIVLGSQALSKTPPGRRRVIVLVTDAGETTSTSPFEAARRAAIQSEALLYTILIRAVKSDTGRNTAGEHAIDTIIDSTGGAMYYPDDLYQLNDMFEKISRELRTQYLLSYYPEPKAKPGTYCRIQLRISGGNYTVHYRKGYLATGPRQ